MLQMSKYAVKLRDSNVLANCLHGSMLAFSLLNNMIDYNK